MIYSIRKATVIGAGTMGAGIAAHLANAGVSVHLLDIVPTELTEREKSRGLDLNNLAVRTRLAWEGLGRIKTNKAVGFYLPKLSERVSIGNIEDHFEWVGDSDWVIEAVIEDLPTKQELMERIDGVRKTGSIITTNTSGIPIKDIAKGRSEDFRHHFFGTHFFNPPRIMKLLEVIPGPETEPALINFMIRFCEEALGKGVVVCKDTPNFIANRIAAIQRSFDMEYVLEQGYTVEEADAVLGPLIGRPKTALFRLADLIGIDVSTRVGKNLYELIPEDEYRDLLLSPHSNDLRERMIAAGMLGRKTGSGFYKRVTSDGGFEFWGLDFVTHEYRGPIAPQFERLEHASQIEDLAERIRFLISASDRIGELSWATLRNVFLYSAYTIPEISDDLISVDRAMRWGYSWEIGPFELWDALGVAEISERIESEGGRISPWVKEMLSGERSHFYKNEIGQKFQYSPTSQSYQEIPVDPQTLSLSLFHREGEGWIELTPAVHLFDLDDGVAFVGVNSGLIADVTDLYSAFDLALEKVEQRFEGMVISKMGNLTTAGISILKLIELIQDQDFGAIEESILQMMRLQARLQSFPLPVVFACTGQATGAEVLTALSAARICADAESRLGFVESALGLVPVAGGCKELMRRAYEPIRFSPTLDPLPFLRYLFDVISKAKVSNSALEARELGFLTDHDDIVMNADHVLRRAMNILLSIKAEGMKPPSMSKPVYVLGERGKAALGASLYLFHESGFLSEDDILIAEKLVHILSGGELTSPQWVEEEYIMELEQEAFLSLIGEAKTLVRLENYAKTRKR